MRNRVKVLGLVLVLTGIALAITSCGGDGGNGGGGTGGLSGTYTNEHNYGIGSIQVTFSASGGWTIKISGAEAASGTYTVTGGILATLTAMDANDLAAQIEIYKGSTQDFTIVDANTLRDNSNGDLWRK